jgi:hypothetical protein
MDLTISAFVGPETNGVSRIKKSGPICPIECEIPSTTNSISTMAEWPDVTLLVRIDVMDSNIIAFAAKHQLEIGERLGFGIHGTVYEATEKNILGLTAVKLHYDIEPFIREFEVYQRLDEYGIKRICGFHVPQLLRVDEELRILQMTMVMRPFVLDFAGAYVDFKPHFSEEIWAEWEAQKRDQYGNKWPVVRQVLDALEEMDIFMIDVSPTNIAFELEVS